MLFLPDTLPDKTQVTAFYLRNKEANRSLKVATHNNLPRKLYNSKWGANASTIRTALALCYSVPEYAAPVCARLSHAQKLNLDLNSACRAVTGCLKPTNVEDLYFRAGIAHLTSGEMYVLEWKRSNRKPMRPTLYMVRTRQREG